MFATRLVPADDALDIGRVVVRLLSTVVRKLSQICPIRPISSRGAMERRRVGNVGVQGVQTRIGVTAKTWKKDMYDPVQDLSRLVHTCFVRPDWPGWAG